MTKHERKLRKKAKKLAKWARRNGYDHVTMFAMGSKNESWYADEVKKLDGVKSPEDVTEELRASVMSPTSLAYLAGANDALKALGTCADVGAAEGIHTFEERFSELNFRMELLKMEVD